jgi:hypothetical protein
MQDSIKRIIAENTSYKVDDMVYYNIRLEVFDSTNNFVGTVRQKIYWQTFLIVDPSYFLKILGG